MATSTDAQTTLPQSGSDKRLKALEKFVCDYLQAERATGSLREAARQITDLLSSDMSEDERNAAWILIQYAKRKEGELREVERALSEQKP